MPIWKCTQCHHEWEGTFDKCSWCGSDGRKLKEKSELEASLKHKNKDKNK